MKFVLATIITTLILWLTSCTSTRPSDVPHFTPPDPYDAEGNLVWVYDAEKDTVTVPYWYWEKIVDYWIDTQEFFKAAGKEK